MAATASTPPAAAPPEGRSDRLDVALLAAAIVVSCGALAGITGSRAASAGSGIAQSSGITQGALLAIALVAGGRLLTAPAGLNYRLAVMALVPVLAIASLTWSIDVHLTARKSANLALLTVIGAMVGQRLSPGRQREVAALALGGVVLLSASLVLFGVPGSVDAKGAWAGVFSQKNSLGRIAALAVVALVAEATRRDTTKRRRWTMLALGGAVSLIALQAQSATALAVLGLLTVALVAVLVVLRRSVGLVAPAFLITSVAAWASISWARKNIAFVADLFGRDETLTGRRQLWESSIEVGMVRSGRGTGWGAFWRGPMEPSGDVWQVIGWPASHAHNGLLDVWLQLGWLGVFVMVCAVAVACVSSARFARLGVVGRSWPATVVLFVILYDITEATMLNGVYWVLFVAAVVGANSRALGEAVPSVPPSSRARGIESARSRR
jgi:O-antigen ligase